MTNCRVKSTFLVKQCTNSRISPGPLTVAEIQLIVIAIWQNQIICGYIFCQIWFYCLLNSTRLQSSPCCVTISPFHASLLLPASRISWTSFACGVQSIWGSAIVQQTLVGSQIWVQVPGPSQILGKPGIHTHTQESNSFQRNGSNFSFPFRVSIFQTWQDILAKTGVTRESPEILRWALQWSHALTYATNTPKRGLCLPK